MASLRPAARLTPNARPAAANPFVAAAVLREQRAAAATAAIEPAVPILVCLAVAALLGAGVALWAALAHVDQCLALARV